MAPDETTIYYVFSTIAQTLSGIVGILAAFAVMRLSELTRRLVEALPSLGKYCQYGESFDASLADGNFEGALNEVFEIDDAGDSLILTACQRAESERKQLSSALRRSLLFASLVIGFSVANLVFAKSIASNCQLAWMMLAMGFVGMVWCLVVVGRLAAPLKTGKSRKKREKQKPR